MKCPHCKSHNLRVIDTRPTDDATGITRRRQCQQCGNKFRTVERMEFAERGILPVGRPSNGSPGIELVAVPAVVVIEQEQPKPALTREEKRNFIRDLKERMRDAQRAVNGQ